ncbi:hypothetical protein BJV78DRAFT_1222746, partial [Lactifluus subvellereus]
MSPTPKPCAPRPSLTRSRRTVEPHDDDDATTGSDPLPPLDKWCTPGWRSFDFTPVS